MSSYALGLIETKGLVGAIEACDAAAKAANVVVSSAEVTDGAYVSLKIEGDLGAVQASVDAGARAAEKVGELISVHVIARPDRGLTPITPPRRYVSQYHPDDTRPKVEPEEEAIPPREKEIRERKAPVRKTPAVKRPTPPPPKPAEEPPAPPPTPPVAPPPVAEAPPVPEALPEEKPGGVKLADLEDMPVVKLRRFARTIKDLPLKGRQISMANKTQLIDAIKSVMKLE